MRNPFFNLFDHNDQTAENILEFKPGDTTGQVMLSGKAGIGLGIGEGVDVVGAEKSVHIPVRVAQQGIKGGRKQTDGRNNAEIINTLASSLEDGFGNTRGGCFKTYGRIDNDFIRIVSGYFQAFLRGGNYLDTSALGPDRG